MVKQPNDLVESDSDPFGIRCDTPGAARDRGEPYESGVLYSADEEHESRSSRAGGRRGGRG